MGGRFRQRMERRQADPLSRWHRPTRLRGPDGRPRRCPLRDDRTRQLQQHVRSELGPAIRSDRRGTDAHPDASVEPHRRLSRVEPPEHRQGQPRVRGGHLRARHVPRAERLRRPVGRRGVRSARLPGSRLRLVLCRARERRQALRLRPERRRHGPPRRRRRHRHGRRDGGPVRRRPRADLGAVRQHVLGVVDALEGRLDRHDRPGGRVLPPSRTAEREHRGVRGRPRFDVRRRRQGGDLGGRRHRRTRPRGSRAVQRHVPVRTRARWAGRAGDRRPRCPWSRRCERRQEGHPRRARLGLRAGRGGAHRAAREGEGGRPRRGRRRRSRLCDQPT